MGLRISCCIHRGAHKVHEPASPPPARVIFADGSLKELPAASHRVAVSDVLGAGAGAAEEAPPFFVCNSDALYFDEHPPALGHGELLRPGQIYFVLPADMLGRRLSSADMAALAVRASSALASGSGKPQRRHGRRGGRSNKKVRVAPVREDCAGDDVDLFNEKLNEQTLGHFGVVLLSPSKMSDEKKVGAAAAAKSQLKRALSIIREDVD